MICSYLKDTVWTAVKRDAKFETRYVKGVPFVDRRYTKVVPVFVKKASPYNNSLSTPLHPPGFISRLLSGYIAIPSVKKDEIISSHSLRVTQNDYCPQHRSCIPLQGSPAVCAVVHQQSFLTSCILASADCFIVRNRLITWQRLIKICRTILKTRYSGLDRQQMYM